MDRLVPCVFCLSVLASGIAQAACDLTPTAGDDSYVCDSGTAAGLTDVSGNNRLALPAGSTATIEGNVTFGPGQDTVAIDNGAITGAVQQGDGVDTFVMTGGSIGALQQGNGRDLFRMSGGTISGAFEDGDVAYLSGGTIGRVDMKLDNNEFYMSGGEILGNLVTGFQRDIVELSAGRIGGNISTSGGDDTITVSGGVLAGQVLASSGSDVVTWRGGTVLGAINLGPDNDTLNLANLGTAALAAPPLFDGGTGSDTLNISNSQPAGGARFVNWETVNLSGGSTWRLDDTLTLGDAETLSGTLAVDATSTLASSGGSLLASQGLATLANGGTLDLTASGASAADTFTVVGNYEGRNGVLKLQSVLAGDGSASDRLVVSGGSLSGLTALQVANLGGAGAATHADGIEVVSAVGGATSSANAFALGNPLAVGAYQYYLFKGGATAGSENNWYLRSSVVTPASGAAPAVAATAAVVGGTVVATATPTLPTAAAGQSILLYRMEAPLYAALAPIANDLLREQVGTFHERHGVPGQGLSDASWGRLLGSDSRRSWAGGAQPRFNGRSNGWQVGQDLWRAPLGSGEQQVGVFAGSLRSRGGVKGFHDGWENNPAGAMSLTSQQLGLYWTWLGSGGAYVDSVLAFNRFDGKARSDRGVALSLDGHGRVASVETGLPIVLGAVKVEPQAQLIASTASLGSAADSVSSVAFSDRTAWQGRLGVRLAPADEAQRGLRPWARLDLRHDFAGHDSVTFGGSDRLASQRRGSRADLGAGVTWQVAAPLALVASASWGQQLDSQPQGSASASLGVRVAW